MNKLVSKNPVLRFKLGKKIEKFQNPSRGIGDTYIRKKSDGTVEVVNGNNINPNFNWNHQGTELYNASRLGRYNLLVRAGLRNPYLDMTPVWQYKDTLLPLYQEFLDSYNQEMIPDKGTIVNKSIPLKKKLSPTIFMGLGILKGWKNTGLWNNTLLQLDTLTEGEKLALLDAGINYKDARTLLQTLNNYIINSGLNNAANARISVDGKWGTLSQAALDFVLNKINQNGTKRFDNNTPEYTIQATPPSLFTGIKPSILPSIENTPLLLKVRANNYNRSQIRELIRQAGFNPYDYTGELRKALRLYLNGLSNDTSLLDGTDLARFTLPYRKQGGLISKNSIERFKEGRKIEIFLNGGVKRFSVSHTDGSKKTMYFNTKEEAKAYQSKQKPGTTVWRDAKEEASGLVLKSNRTKEKATEWGRNKLEKYNNLSFKLAYQEGRKTGNKYFAYKGKVYKTDLNNGKDNMTEMMLHYGNNLGYDKDPKLLTKPSRAARELYRKDINTSETGHTKEIVKTPIPYRSSYDGGELFANFMGLASPTRWVGAVSRASRGEGNTGTFVGKVLNNMLDPQNGARENQGIFSLGLSQNDEQWAAEHPVTSGVVNGILDSATYGPKPKFTKEFKFQPRYGWKGRTYNTVKEEVPMGIYEGDLNISAGTTLGRNPYVELGNKVGETTKTITKKKMTNPGTRYVKSVIEKPTGKYNFSWTEGMKDMFPWITATTNNNIMK